MKKYFVIESTIYDPHTESGCCSYGDDECYCEEASVKDISLKELTMDEIIKDPDFISKLKQNGFYTKEELQQNYPNITHLENFVCQKSRYCIEPLASLEKAITYYGYNEEPIKIYQEVFQDSIQQTKIVQQIKKHKERIEKANQKAEEQKVLKAEKAKQRKIEKAKRLLETLEKG